MAVSMDCEKQEVLWQPQEQSPFLSFATELILLILSKLPISFVPTVSLVCEQLRCCMDDSSLWKQRCITLKASGFVYEKKWKETCKSFVLSRKFFGSIKEENPFSSIFFNYSNLSALKFIDEKRLITTTSNGHVNIWDVKKSQKLRQGQFKTFTGRAQNGIMDFCFFGVNKLISFSFTSNLQLWDIGTYSQQEEIVVDEAVHPITSIASKGSTVFIGSAYKTIYYRDLNHSNQFVTMDSHKPCFMGRKRFRDGRTVPRERNFPIKEAVAFLKIQHDLLAVGEKTEGTVKLWDLTSMRVALSLTEQDTQGVTSMSFEEGFVAASYQNKKILCWDIRNTSSPVVTIDKLNKNVSSVVLRNGICVYPLNSTIHFHRLSSKEHKNWSLAFSSHLWRPASQGKVAVSDRSVVFHRETSLYFPKLGSSLSPIMEED